MPPTDADDYAPLTGAQKTAIRKYMLMLVALPAILLGAISFFLGYFVKSVAYDEAATDAYKIAYSEAFKAAADTITRSASDVTKAATTAQESLDKITRVSNDSLATSDQINRQKQIIDGILQKNFEEIAKGIVNSPAKDEIIKVSQPEIISMRASITDLKTRLDKLPLQLQAQENNLSSISHAFTDLSRSFTDLSNDYTVFKRSHP
jgi:hypothetical protein